MHGRCQISSASSRARIAGESNPCVKARLVIAVSPGGLSFLVVGRFEGFYVDPGDRDAGLSAEGVYCLWLRPTLPYLDLP